MTSKWKECKLGDVVNLKRGYDLPRSKRQEGNVPVVSSSGITGHHNEAKVKAPGVVTGRYGTLGEIHYIEKDFWPLNTTLYVQDFKGNDPRYVSYLLLTLNFAVQNVAAAVPGVNRNFLHQLSVRVPPLPTQRKIAAVLSAYDDLIENNTRRIAILEEMAQTLYHEWFVRFRFPGHEQVAMVDSELGPIPEGWEVGRLDDALLLQRGFDLPRKKRREGKVPVYAATRVVGTHNEAKVKAPGVVTGRSGSLGTVMYVEDDFWPLNTTLWVREFRQVTPLYAYYLLSDMHLENYNSGAAVPTLNRNDIHGLPVVLPPAGILKEFDDYTLPLLAMRTVLRERNDVLRRTRDLLLPRLISSEVDVSDLNL